MNTTKKCLGLRSPADWLIWTSSVTPRVSVSCARNSAKFRDMQICLCGMITQLWHHGHLVFMVSCIYDPTLYLTPEEYPQRTGKWVDTSNQRLRKLQVELEGRGIMKDANRMLKLDREKELARELRGLCVSALAIVCSNPAQCPSRISICSRMRPLAVNPCTAYPATLQMYWQKNLPISSEEKQRAGFTRPGSCPLATEAEDEESISNAIKGTIKSTSNNKALAMWSQIYYHDFKLKKKMGVE